MEHRCGFRRTATAQVLIRTPDGISAKAELRNISASGALLRTHLPTPLYALVSVRFPGRFDQHWIEAHVVRQADEVLAVEWTEFSPEIVRQVLLSLSRHEVPIRVAVDLG